MELKSICKAQKVPLMQRIGGHSLTRSAADVLLSKARIMVDGDAEILGADSFFSGSILVDIDVAEDMFTLPAGDESLELLAQSLRKSVLFRLNLMRLARREVARKGDGLEPGTLQLETEMRVEAGRLMVDISVECELLSAEQPEVENHGGLP